MKCNKTVKFGCFVLAGFLLFLQGCRTSVSVDDGSHSMNWRVSKKSRFINARSLEGKYSNAFYFVDSHSLIHTWESNYLISDTIILGFDLNVNGVSDDIPGLCCQEIPLFVNNMIRIRDMVYKINTLASATNRQDRFVRFYSASKARVRGLVRFPASFSDEQVKQDMKTILAGFNEQ
jgi:hypothetical protein